MEVEIQATDQPQVWLSCIVAENAPTSSTTCNTSLLILLHVLHITTY